jgi:methyl-accepting chemotaxis protein
MLIDLQGDLQELNASVAKEFGELAGALQSISGQVNSITNLSRQTTGLAMEGESDKAIGTLKQVLGDAEGVQSMAESSREELRGILSSLRQIRSPLLRLAKLHSMLNAVGTLSRIEGSRLGNTTVDLSSLSKDIDMLAEQIEKHVTAIAEESGKLAELVENGVRQLDQKKGAEQQQASEFATRTRTVLDSLHTRATAAKSAAVNIDEQYASIRGATDRIVMSLQAEDITRQRMEHVQEALSQISAGVESGQAESDSANILALQRSQVAGARDLLINAFATMLEGVGSLTLQVEKLTTETAALASQTDQNGQSFAAVTEGGLKTITNIFAQYSASAQAVVTTVETLVPSVAAMTKGANELEEIEASIHLIALNAAIKTAHLGNEGAAMSVLATEMQKITAQSVDYTKTVLQGLLAMDQSLRNVSTYGVESSNSLLRSSGVEEMQSEVHRLTELVVGASKGMSQNLASLLEMADGLQTELHAARTLAERGNGIEQRFSTVLQRLDEKLEQFGFKAGGTLQTGTGDQAAQIAALYSMQSERQAHEEVFGIESQPSNAPTDDDVELF